MAPAPLVTVLVAVHDGAPYVRTAIASVLRQSVSDLEVVVVDDASGDETPEILESFRDDRLRVLRTEEQRGLAASLNRGLGKATGTYLARMDADDAAFPEWLERSLVLLRADPTLALVGSSVLDIDSRGRPLRLHVHDSGKGPTRWRALFSAPVFHDTVLLDRAVLDREGLHYDEGFGESEDYELWGRLLDVAEANSLEDPLVLHRLHEAQATRRRGDLQRTLAEDVSQREIAKLAPDLEPDAARLARAVAMGVAVASRDQADAVAAITELLRRFEEAHRYATRDRDVVRASVARALVRLARSGGTSARAAALREAARLDPAFAAHAFARRRWRGTLESRAGRRAEEWLAQLAHVTESPPIRVTAVFPEPTPYRSPLLDRVAGLPEIELTVVYAADTVAGRTWMVEPQHRAIFLRGLRVPGAKRAFHHDYPLTPGVVGVLRKERPEVVVVSGWSTFAAQAAIAWCGAHHIPYVLVVESHDEHRRAGWRRAVKSSVVPPVVRNASGVLVTGTLARKSMLERGAPPERVRVFANTVDVEAFAELAAGLASERDALRARLGASPEDVVVLSVSRLASEKGLDVLARAVAAADDPRLVLVVAGEGPQRESLERLIEELGVRACLVGDVEWARIVELYACADVFALLSEREPWAVVVNEAAACGLPLVLSDQVGAAHDLLRDGENGKLVAVGDSESAGRALAELVADPARRRAMGERSRELARDWGYGPSVDGFLAAVREAAGRIV